MTAPVIDRLIDAINQHDLDAMTECFAPDFTNVWPVHPVRSFTGRDHLRSNWEGMFEARPDIKATVGAQAKAGNEAWGEWEFEGTERDGGRFHQRGVIIVVTEGDVITEARFYLEPVDAPA
jgi:ketosteroid isomerase-like protein